MVCFSTNLQAAKFMGIANLILHSIVLAIFLVELEELEGAFGEPITHGAIGTLGVILLVDVGLAYGSFNKIGSLMTTWSVVVGIGTLLFVIGTITVISTSFVWEELLLGIAITVGNIRAIVTVSIAVTEIEEEKRNAVIGIASNPEIQCIA